MLAINPALPQPAVRLLGHTRRITARRKASLNALRVVYEGERRCERRSNGGGTPFFSLWRRGAIRPPDEAGTRYCASSITQ